MWEALNIYVDSISRPFGSDRRVKVSDSALEDRLLSYSIDNIPINPENGDDFLDGFSLKSYLSDLKETLAFIINHELKIKSNLKFRLFVTALCTKINVGDDNLDNILCRRAKIFLQ